MNTKIRYPYPPCNRTLGGGCSTCPNKRMFVDCPDEPKKEEKTS